MTLQPTVARTLLANLFDYAGLFPPADLSMENAVANFVRDRAGAFGWMLNSFVVTTQRLDEFIAAVTPLNSVFENPISLSVLVADAGDAQTVARFFRQHADIASIESLETKSADLAAILTKQVDRVYVEIPCGEGAAKSLQAAKSTGAFAKIRTGGVIATAFPSSPAVAEFLVACHNHDVSLKATAGLHHPLPAIRPTTSATDSPSAKMHGFLNVLLAVSSVQCGASVDAVANVLAQPSMQLLPEITVEQARQIRHRFHSIGSCSFSEPIEDLIELGLLS